MDGIEEISTIGRALGVYLILSMQRPDADVLDGKLKNNLTVRMAFRHADEINSRITIGSGEAAEIKQSEKGRMVLKLDGASLYRGLIWSWKKQGNCSNLIKGWNFRNQRKRCRSRRRVSRKRMKE